MSCHNRIGLFGGSFNPIHIGHLILADQAYHELNLEKIIWLPGGDPPHKGEMLDKELRGEMVRLALKEHVGFEFSDWEMKQEGPSYTLNTLKHFKTLYPNYELCFLMGEDSLCTFDTWYHYEELFSLASFYVAKRKDSTEACPEKTEFFRKNGAKIEFLSMPNIDISSTMVRRRCKSNRSFRYFLPKSVYQFIVKRGLYGYRRN